MFCIDDLWQMGILKRITWKCQFDLRDDFLYQRRLDRFIDQQVIRRYTSLSAVEKLAEDDTLRRTFQMGAALYDTGTFSTQFQSNRSQMTACFFHDGLCYGNAAGKKDVVKALLQ